MLKFDAAKSPGSCSTPADGSRRTAVERVSEGYPGDICVFPWEVAYHQKKGFIRLKKSYVAVCMSNLSQLSKANSMFLRDHQQKFIDQVDQLNRRGGLNVGYAYAGLGGSWNPDVPLNKYLGEKDSGLGIMDIVLCPERNENDDSVQHFGSSYMAAARVRHNNDLDGTSGANDSTLQISINRHLWFSWRIKELGTGACSIRIIQ